MDTAITGWRLYQRDLSKVPKKFKAVIESGIYWRLQIEATHQKYLLRRPLIRLEPYVMHAELNGAFSTLFVLCGGTVILATLVALVEIRETIIDLAVKSFNYVVMQALFVYYTYVFYCKNR